MAAYSRPQTTAATSRPPPPNGEGGPGRPHIHNTRIRPAAPDDDQQLHRVVRSICVRTWWPRALCADRLATSRIAARRTCVSGASARGVASASGCRAGGGGAAGDFAAFTSAGFLAEPAAVPTTASAQRPPRGGRTPASRRSVCRCAAAQQSRHVVVDRFLVAVTPRRCRRSAGRGWLGRRRLRGRRGCLVLRAVRLRFLPVVFPPSGGPCATRHPVKIHRRRVRPLAAICTGRLRLDRGGGPTLRRLAALLAATLLELLFTRLQFDPKRTEVFRLLGQLPLRALVLGLPALLALGQHPLALGQRPPAGFQLGLPRHQLLRLLGELSGCLALPDLPKAAVFLAGVLGGLQPALPLVEPLPALGKLGLLVFKCLLAGVQLGLTRPAVRSLVELTLGLLAGPAMPCRSARVLRSASTGFAARRAVLALGKFGLLVSSVAWRASNSACRAASRASRLLNRRSDCSRSACHSAAARPAWRGSTGFAAGPSPCWRRASSGTNHECFLAGFRLGLQGGQLSRADRTLPGPCHVSAALGRFRRTRGARGGGTSSSMGPLRRGATEAAASASVNAWPFTRVSADQRRTMVARSPRTIRQWKQPDATGPQPQRALRPGADRGGRAEADDIAAIAGGRGSGGGRPTVRRRPEGVKA